MGGFASWSWISFRNAVARALSLWGLRQFQSISELCHGLLEAPLWPIDVAQVAAGLGKIRIQFQGLLKL